MAKENKFLIFVVGFVCAWMLFSSAADRRAECKTSIPSNISFSGESNVIYFLDRDEGVLYRYNTQGRMTRSYAIEELGKDLEKI